MRTTLSLCTGLFVLACVGCSDDKPVTSTTTVPPAQPVQQTTVTAQPVVRTASEPASVRPPMANDMPNTTANGTTVTTGDQTMIDKSRIDKSVADAPMNDRPMPMTPAVTTVDRMPVDHTSAPMASSETMTPMTPVSTTTEAALLPDRTMSDKVDAAQNPADNSGRNKREDGAELTPLDQGNSSSDIKTTAAIRSAITDRDDLSTNAKNIKIITSEGAVTLRGVVADDRERTVVMNIARDVAGQMRVDDRLDLMH